MWYKSIASNYLLRKYTTLFQIVLIKFFILFFWLVNRTENQIYSTWASNEQIQKHNNCTINAFKSEYSNGYFEIVQFEVGDYFPLFRWRKYIHRILVALYGYSFTLYPNVKSSVKISFFMCVVCINFWSHMRKSKEEKRTPLKYLSIKLSRLNLCSFDLKKMCMVIKISLNCNQNRLKK